VSTTGRGVLCGALALAVQASGCGSMLPRSHAENPSPFQSYEQAQQALERVRPYSTNTAELEALGLDPADSANVEQVPYPQWVSVLMHQSVPRDAQDPGIRDCIAAEQGCRAFIFRYGVLNARREGAFLSDFLNFRRETRTLGWRFEAVLLVRGDTVLFRNHAGQAHIEQLERRRNPLGPLQSIGEAAPRVWLSP
jgi:hypothetical protein